jgi:hypothetical protein
MHPAEVIKRQLITEAKAALSSYYPSSAGTEVEYGYFGERMDEGDPIAMMGDFYVAVHNVNSRDAAQGTGQPYRDERWDAAVTVTVRSSYAPDRKIHEPVDFLDELCRAVANRLSEREWEIIAAINTTFAVTHPNTNGLVRPFGVQTPAPRRDSKPLAWAKAREGKSTSQKNLLSATIRLVDAQQIQYKSGIA